MAWWVVQTQPNRETVALERLTRAGYTAYSPVTEVRRSHQGKRRWEKRWLFSRYVFVQTTAHWYPITYLDGVSKLLMTQTNEQPAPAVLPDVVIDDLRTRENARGVIEPRRLKRGQKLLISDGPFAGLLCNYEGMGRHDHEIVAVDLLGRATKVEVPSGVLQPY